MPVFLPLFLSILFSARTSINGQFMKICGTEMPLLSFKEPLFDSMACN